MNSNEFYHYFKGLTKIKYENRLLKVTTDEPSSNIINSLNKYKSFFKETKSLFLGP